MPGVQLQSKNLNIASLFSWLTYASFRILLQAVFMVYFVIGQEILSYLESIWFTPESTYSVFQQIYAESSMASS